MKHRMKKIIGITMVCIPAILLFSLASICTGMWWFGPALFGGILFTACWFATAAYLINK